MNRFIAADDILAFDVAVAGYLMGNLEPAGIPLPRERRHNTATLERESGGPFHTGPQHRFRLRHPVYVMSSLRQRFEAMGG